MTIDTKEFDLFIKNIDFSTNDSLSIEKKGAKVLIEGMQSRARVDSGDMRDSVKQHIIKSTKEVIEDHVGPESTYAVYNEFGTGIYAESGAGRKTPWVYRDRNGNFHRTEGMRAQPFVRPTAREDGDKCVDAIKKEFGRLVLKRWHK
jgi:HK97 gp10 family phage protein